MRLLLLAGSTEASSLAARLVPAGIDVVSSFAGRTSQLAALPGEVRVGGFGGVAGLVSFMKASGVDAVIDATHPFTAQMPWNCYGACREAGVPRLRVCRPGWTAVDGDRWHRVGSLAGAAVALGSLGARRVFLTTGRTELSPFASVTGAWFLVRSIEAPSPGALPGASVVLDRGPFSLDGELSLLRSNAIDTLVTKDSGGAAAAAKLEACRVLGLPVVMVDRPAAPPGPLVTTVEEAVAWVAALAG
jgi:precorrin-6A/cobalt-precorrin-6A reductase